MLSFILEEIMKKLSLILIASTFATVHAAPITLKSPQKDQLGYSYGYLMGKGKIFVLLFVPLYVSIELFNLKL